MILIAPCVINFEFVCGRIFTYVTPVEEERFKYKVAVQRDYIYIYNSLIIVITLNSKMGSCEMTSTKYFLSRS